MQDDMTERILKEAEYIIKTGATVRSAAKVFCFSKSTIHKDVSQRLQYIDNELYLLVKNVLEKNLSERHIRGGIATRLKYAKEKNKK